MLRYAADFHRSGNEFGSCSLGNRRAYSRTYAIGKFTATYVGAWDMGRAGLRLSETGNRAMFSQIKYDLANDRMTIQTTKALCGVHHALGVNLRLGSATVV